MVPSRRWLHDPGAVPGGGDPGDAGWHIDSSYEVDRRWQVNVPSRARGLLALYLFTDVDEEADQAAPNLAS